MKSDDSGSRRDGTKRNIRSATISKHYDGTIDSILNQFRWILLIFRAPLYLFI